MNDMNWKAALRALRTETAEAQDRANRLAVEGHKAEAALADQHAEMLRVLYRVLQAGVTQ